MGFKSAKQRAFVEAKEHDKNFVNKQPGIGKPDKQFKQGMDITNLGSSFQALQKKYSQPSVSQEVAMSPPKFKNIRSKLKY